MRPQVTSSFVSAAKAEPWQNVGLEDHTIYALVDGVVKFSYGRQGRGTKYCSRKRGNRKRAE